MAIDYTWALNQTATYWARLDPDGYGGWDYDDPVEVSVRWEETSENLIDASGEEFVTLAEIMVNQEMKPGDYLYLGSLTSAMEDSASNPVNIEDAWPIRKAEAVPDLLAESFVRTVWI